MRIIISVGEQNFCSWLFPEEMKVEAHIHKLQTIIRNLLPNAEKFTLSDGSVHISAFTMEEHFVTIAVKDTGIGIKAEDVQQIIHFDVNNKAKGN